MACLSPADHIYEYCGELILNKEEKVNPDCKVAVYFPWSVWLWTFDSSVLIITSNGEVFYDILTGFGPPITTFFSMIIILELIL